MEQPLEMEMAQALEIEETPDRDSRGKHSENSTA